MGCYTQRIICNSFHLALCEALCVPLHRLLLVAVLVRELFQFFFRSLYAIVGCSAGMILPFGCCCWYVVDVFIIKIFH